MAVTEPIFMRLTLTRQRL